MSSYVVTGCGRSGTAYVSSLLRRMGRDVGHEFLGRDGIVSWYLAHVPEIGFIPPHVATYEVWYQDQPDIRFAQIVREPLACIASCQTHTEGAWRHFAYLLPGVERLPIIERAMWYWLAWNQEAEKLARVRFRVERIGEEFGRFCRYFRVKPDRKALRTVPTDLNTRTGQYRPLSWSDLDRANNPLADGIRCQAKRYGY